MNLDQIPMFTENQYINIPSSSSTHTYYQGPNYNYNNNIQNNSFNTSTNYSPAHSPLCNSSNSSKFHLTFHPQFLNQQTHFQSTNSNHNIQYPINNNNTSPLISQSNSKLSIPIQCVMPVMSPNQLYQQNSGINLNQRIKQENCHIQENQIISNSQSSKCYFKFEFFIIKIKFISLFFSFLFYNYFNKKGLSPVMMSNILNPFLSISNTTSNIQNTSNNNNTNNNMSLLYSQIHSPSPGSSASLQSSSSSISSTCSSNRLGKICF